jgi:cupin fold WbuC family metalloprotein
MFKEAGTSMSERAFQIVDHLRVDLLAREAEASQRKRAHLLLHSGPDDQVQRLLIALQPGTYVRPHHHSEQWEMLILLSGRADLLGFSLGGQLLDRYELSTAAPVAQIPVDAWHGVVALETNTVIMEVKPGPFRPNEFADWAPSEGGKNVHQFLEWLAKSRSGAIWPEGRP